MKKFTVCIISLVTMIVSLCACGGGSTKKCSPQLNTAFCVTAHMEYEDMKSDAAITRMDINQWNVEFSSPDTLAGVILTFNDNNVEASYNGLSFSVPKSALPIKSMIATFIEAVESNAQLSELEGKEKDNEIVVDGETELGKYSMKFDKNNNLSGFEMDNLKLTISFTDFRQINNASNEATSPNTEAATQSLTEITTLTTETETVSTETETEQTTGETAVSQ